MQELMKNFIYLFTESAPFLLFGLLLAGLINQIIPHAWVQKTLGKNSSVLVAALIGTPLPLCSCSVIPAAIGLRRAGASKASTASFMVATPETGIDSIGVTFALMGPIMAIARPIAAIISAITAGTLVRWWDIEQPYQSPLTSAQGCCHGQEESQPEQLKNVYQKIQSVVQYGYGKLLADFMSWLLLGLFFAAMIQTFIPSSILTSYGSGWLAILLIIVMSIPMYICATASTPIAAGLMLSGISPGIALIFMLTGPATNIATLMVIKNELGKRSLIAYLSGVILMAILMGLGFDFILNFYGIELQVSHGEHSQMTSWLYHISAFLLALLIVWQYIKKLTAQ